MSYIFSKKLTGEFEVIIERITDALKQEGFGVLTTIVVKETLKKSWMSISGNIQ